MKHDKSEEAAIAGYEAMRRVPEPRRRGWDAKRAHIRLKHYVDTYITVLEAHKEINEEIFLADMLYGIAISLNDKFMYDSGYRKFKNQLSEKLLIDSLKGK